MNQNSIQTILQNAVDNIVESGVVETAMQKAIEEAVLRAVKDCFSSYSEFDKQLKEAISESMKVGDDFGKIDLPSYNHTMMQIIERQVAAATAGSIQRGVAERMKDLLVDPPEKVLLSELVEQYRKFLQERYRSGCVCHDEEMKFTFILDRDRYGIDICFAEEPNVQKYSCPIRLTVSDSNQRILTMNLGSESEKKMFAGPFFSFERSLFQMHAAKTQIEIDIEHESDVDTSYSDYSESY